MSSTDRRHVTITLLLALLCGISCRKPDERTDVAPDTEQLIERCIRGETNELIIHDEVNARQWSQILELEQLVALELHRCGFRDLSGIEAMQQLQRLRLEDLPCDDQDVALIAQLSELRVLNLPQSSLSDGGLEQLASMPRLELLRFGSPQVTDLGVAKLANAPSLRFLHLIRVPITDAGLRAFHDMKQLESLYIDGGHESDDGIRALLEAHPRLHFHQDQLHLANDPRSDGH